MNSVQALSADHPAFVEAAPRATFNKWLGRASLALLVVGPAALYALRAPTTTLSAAQAWGCIAATVATVLGVVTAVTCATSSMNHH